MDSQERERLRERLNFPSIVHDEPIPTLTPVVDDRPEVDRDADREVDPAGGLVAALERLADAVERIDGRLEATRVDLNALHERLDRLELAIPSEIYVDDLAGMEAVRRTVAASHRALTAQLGRMFEGVEAKLRQDDRMAVSVGSPD